MARNPGIDILEFGKKNPSPVFQVLRIFIFTQETQLSVLKTAGAIENCNSYILEAITS